ncbi:MAG: signal peptide peptidase SppA [Phycisphaerales bacterium]|nr:signal peptide peptidase SppA [Phycisphaerales bacterium]
MSASTCQVSKLIVALLGVSVLAGCAPTAFLITPVSGSRSLEAHIVESESVLAIKRIALIEVDGQIFNQRSSSLIGPAGDNPVVLFREKLQHAASDDRVKAVVLRINSPGGGVTATDMMYADLQRFRTQTGKPVVAMMLDVAASGGYYLACGADEIWAQPTTVTGSIGVIMILPELSGLMNKLGLAANTIKSGPMKDAGSPFRPMKDDERAAFQRIIDQMYERFLAVVREGRPKVPADQLRSIADGRVYLAQEAMGLGLVDRVGTLEDAIAAAKARAGIADSKVQVVEYARPAEYRANYYARSGSGAVNMINVELPTWLTAEGPEFMYLWSPAR